MIDLITGLLGGIWQGLALVAGAVIVVGVAYLKGRSAGKAKAKTEHLEDTITKVDQINEARSDNAGLSDDQLRDKLLRSRTKRGR